MINISTVMGNKRFAYLIVFTFIADSILLIGIQLNSARNTKALITNNNTSLHELRSSNHLREIDRDILGVESRIRASIATNDTTHLEGIDQKINQIEGFLDSLSQDNKDPGEEKLIRRLSVLALIKRLLKSAFCIDIIPWVIWTIKHRLPIRGHEKFPMRLLPSLQKSIKAAN